ncbi:MAG: Lactonase, 7-bladed beta-propeller, partial [Gaiellaceae bacterium]|nr:Lactonase, 7-bladed beta-propeller [Gaiellaceae bacterium]
MLARDRGFCTPTRGVASITVVLSTLLATALVCAATAASAVGAVFSEQSCLKGVTPNAPNCTFDPVLGSPISLAVSPDGRFLYVGGEAGNQSSRLQVFGPKGSGGFQRIQCLTGDSTDSTCTFEPKLLDSPTNMEVSADGKNLYFGSHNGVLFAFARTTSGPNEGHVAPLAGRRACTAGANDQLVQDGICTSVRRMVTALQSDWVKISPDQQFVYTGGQGAGGSISIFQRDPTDGSL